jgi:type IV secretion system protein VirB1
MLGAELVIRLAEQCAPQAAPQTLLAIARVESGLDPLVIGVNRPVARRVRSATVEEAAAQAKALIAAGANVDLGLVQINSANLHRLGLSVSEAFDPCRNLAAGAILLQGDYLSARGAWPDAQAALRSALSLYNTGDVARGIRNGYVARVVVAAAGQQARASDAPAQAPAPAPWDVFGQVRTATFVLFPTLNLQGAR